MGALEHDFMHEVANTPRGNGILLCIQCGRCSSDCPVARLTAEYNPRRLMEMIILGLRSGVIPTQLPWYCLSCFTCLDRCPQGGDVGEAMFAIRNIAAKERNVPKGIITQAKNLVKTGCVVPPDTSIMNRRKELGLSKCPSRNIKDVQKILKKTGLDKIAST